MTSKLTIEHRDDGWWIAGLPDGFEDCGPYKTHKDATVARKGVMRTLAHLDDRSFFTCERIEG